MSGETHDGVSARQTLRRAANLFRAARGNWKYMLILIGTPVLIILLYSLPRGQSYVVEARTLGARVTFLGPDALWKLPKATYCQTRGENRDLRTAAKFQGEGCNPGLFEIHTLPDAEIRIPSGVPILIRSEPDGSMLLRRLAVPDEAPKAAPALRLSDALTWTPNSLLRIDAEGWMQVTLLEFVGDVVVGEEAGSGSNSYLIEGRYDVRERLLWRSDSAEPTTVFEGTLYRGDRVAFYGDEEDAEVLLTGFIAPYLEDDRRGFGIVLSNGLDRTDSQLGIKSFGAREVLVSPSWTDRALRDPLLLALTAILGFAVTSLTFAVEVRRLAALRDRS
ncbi:MAG: hypothetical protein AB3N19_07675 [Ruegeria sp.]